MIRRGFWLTAGAVTGIYGYRRACAIGRRLSARLNPASPGPSLTPEASATQAPEAKLAREARLVRGAALVQGARLARRGQRGAANATREIVGFTRDVREGMDLYTARHSAPAGSTLSTDRDSTTRESATRQSTTRDSTTRDSTIRESATRQSATRDSAIRQSATRQSTTHEPEDGH